jgi:hypothetical protein
MRSKSNKMFIYGIIDPRNNNVFYVGQSKNILVRLFDHIHKCHLKKSKKDLILLEICEAGLFPKFSILETIDVDLSSIESIENVSKRERYWLDKFDNLTNLQVMGKRNPSDTDFSNGKINCLYCGKEIGFVTAKKKFCSDLHRVYWNREQKLNRKEIKIQDDTTPTNVIKPFEQPKTNYTINTTGEKMPDSLNWKEQLEWKRNHKK